MPNSDITGYFTVYNIIVIILIIIGLIWLFSSLWYNAKINRIRSWPRTDAIIINALLEPESHSNMYVRLEDLTPVTDTTIKFIPRVLYTYTVSGRTYQSTSFMYGGEKAYDALTVQSLMGHMKPNATIQIYYNPDAPEEAYIYNGPHNYTGVWIGIILLIIAGILAYYHNVVDKNKGTKKYNDYDVTTPTLTEMTPTSASRTKTNRPPFRRQFY